MHIVPGDISRRPRGIRLALAYGLTTVGQNLDALKNNITTFKSNLEDVDIETAMTELTNRQVAYQAALLATTKVTGLNLVDYLK